MNDDPRLGHPLPSSPVDSNSAFGWRTHPQTGERTFHYGEDYAVPTGTPIAAVADSRVVFVGSQIYRRENGTIGGAGNYLIAEILDDGESTGLYYSAFHASRIDVEEGQIVSKGDTLALVGSTGGSTGPHLHFELFEGGREPLLERGLIGSSGARRLDPNAYIGASYLDRITLREGDQNPAVADLQRTLIARGLLGEGEDDGWFGDDTKAAVERLQEELGVSVDGVFGRETRTALGAQAPGLPQEPPRPPSPDPQPDDRPTAPAFSTAGPFATTAVGDLLGVRGGTPLGALSADESYAFGRAVLGDSEGAAALEFLDRQLGTGDGVLVQRMVALGLHEGQLHAGRANPDPASGYNNGTFQLGGRDTTPASTAANQARLLDRGIAFLAERGHTVDAGSLTAMDRDVITHIGYLEDRGQTAYRTPLAEGQLVRELGDASITGDRLVHLMHHRVQGGIRDIGESVRAWTDPRTGLGVDLDAVAARAAEPDEVRREPAMPTLDRRLHPGHYDTARGPVTSPAVAQWQAVLQAEGFLDEAPDGIFGDRTIAATRAAQRAAGLAPDGAVGPDTWGAYSDALGRIVEGSPADPAPDLDAARATLAANRSTVDLMDQVDGLVDNLLDSHTDRYAEARQALVSAGRGQRDPMTAASVRDVLAAQTPPLTGLSDLEARAVADGVNVGTELARAHPEVAAARALVAEADRADALDASSPARQLDDRTPRVGETAGGDGVAVDRARVSLDVSPDPVPIDR